MANEESYSWGAVPDDDGTWRFRLWAPACETMTLRLGGDDIAMTRDTQGWFTAQTAGDEGDHYAYVLPDGQTVPDPAARRQKDGVHGPSLLTAPAKGHVWDSRPWEESVIYELHIGTFTKAGTYAAAAEELERIADLGFTAIEIMPVSQFGGDRGWGYDGVLPYCPHNVYGSPQDLRALIAAAHAQGLMVLLDVVWNHFGPDGNYLPLYCPDFFDTGRTTPWGAAIDYTQGPVRQFFFDNAVYWCREFGFDGLRLDAIDQIVDPSEPELLMALPKVLHDRLPDRRIHLTTEDNRNVTHLHARDPNGKIALHAGEWNDDVHNAAHVLATGETEGYYSDFADDPLGHLGRALATGFSFQGQGGRGQPSDHQPPTAFVDFLQNHDQTGNRALGERLVTLGDPDTVAALTAILGLSPHIPLFFMGEEYDETNPFLFFAHFGNELDDAVRSGRREEFAGFSGFAAKDVPDPIAMDTFERSTLDHSRRETDAGRAAAARLRQILDIRHTAIVPRLKKTRGHAGRLIEAAHGRLAVDWQLDGARLSLRARFGAAPLSQAEGDILHRTGDKTTQAETCHTIIMTT